MESFFGQYYGMDWLAMITSLLFMYYIGNKKRFGFIFGFISGLAWIFTNYVAHIWAGIILNLILLILHVRGYMKWETDAKKDNSLVKNK